MRFKIKIGVIGLGYVGLPLALNLESILQLSDTIMTFRE